MVIYFNIYYNIMLHCKYHKYRYKTRLDKIPFGNQVYWNHKHSVIIHLFNNLYQSLVRLVMLFCINNGSLRTSYRTCVNCPARAAGW